MTKHSTPTSKPRISQHTYIPTWFVAQCGAVKEAFVRHTLINNGVKIKRVKAENYDGPFIPEVVKKGSTYHLAQIGQVRHVVNTKMELRARHGLETGIERIRRGLEAKFPEPKIDHGEFYVALSCALDRMVMGVTSYEKGVEELKGLFESIGVSWKGVPVDFKNKLRNIGRV